MPKINYVNNTPPQQNIQQTSLRQQAQQQQQVNQDLQRKVNFRNNTAPKMYM